MLAYPTELRERVAAARDDGMGTREVAELFGCSESWVRRLLQRRTERGSLDPIERCLPDQRSLDDDDRAALAAALQAKPDLTLKELAAMIGHKVHSTTICRELKAMNLTRKKSRRTRPSKTAPT
jgi:transposase